MVDVAAKTDTPRLAIARGRIRMSAQAYALLTQPGQGKREVLSATQIAAILAAKRCAELIPLCHSLLLAFVGVEFSLNDDTCSVDILANCKTQYKTGVEMEAMTACSVAALTIYDMCKAANKGIVIEQIYLTYKAGGKSGEWRND